MTHKDPYQIIKHLHTTEKTVVLQELKNADSNACVAKCDKPKYVFVVHKDANKQEIKAAIEEIYSDRNIRVKNVNTINLKGKKRRVRGRQGVRPSTKKAIITLEAGDSLENV